MSVMSDDIAIAGETFSLECRVETVEEVRPEDVSITWRVTGAPEPSGENIKIKNITTESTVIRGRLVFSTLHTSDRGQYTCTGRILAESVGVDVSNTSIMKIDVTSKW